MGLLITLLIAAALLLIYYFWNRRQPGRGKAGALRQEARSLLKMPQGTADETIDRYIKNLQERFPNRDEEWYLEKIIHDLKRDR